MTSFPLLVEFPTTLLRFVHNLVILLLLALWMPATLHCDLEAAGLSTAAHTQEHDSRCAIVCSCDGCSAVEDGSYRPSDDLIKVPPLACCDADCFACIALMAAPALEPVLLRSGAPEPEALQPSWYFVRRAAPSPRAPSCVIA